MIAYEYYSLDDDKPGDVHFLGILPERREDWVRVTSKSILDMGREFIGDETQVKELYFIQVEVP
jgi:hypothetical protein